MTEKYKIITISDHPLYPSGVGIQTKYIIEGLLKTGKFKVISLGAAMKHSNYNPIKIQEYQDDWVIIPIDGYGNPDFLREMLDVEKPDALWFMTDPRFYYWLFEISDEIRDRGIPMFYYHVWDNYPVPDFNKDFYKSCDFVGCISKLTHNVLKACDMEENSKYIPHGVDHSIFKQHSKERILELKAQLLKDNKNKFVFFYNSRNARRKLTSDIIKNFKLFLDNVGHDKAFMLMHTNPIDKEGADLTKLAQMLKLTNQQIVFSHEKLVPENLTDLYNIADVTMNLSCQEGFGLSCLESLACGTPVIINKTGGLQDQPVDDDGNIFGVMVEPVVKSLTGSLEVPYIFDDRCSDKDIIEAMYKMYSMSLDDRLELGKKAEAWTKKMFTVSAMIDSWNEVILKYIEKYKISGNPDRIKFQIL